MELLVQLSVNFPDTNKFCLSQTGSEGQKQASHLPHFTRRKLYDFLHLWSRNMRYRHKCHNPSQVDYRKPDVSYLV